jgi:hypothetical protein
VWQCPVCSSRISAYRAGALTDAIEEWRSVFGGSVLLFTFTLRHSREDELAALVEVLGAAFARWRQGRIVRDVLADLGSPGFVRSVEGTYGQATGWHPHIHALWFVRADGLSSGAELRLREAWHRAVEASGGSCDVGVGLDVRGGAAAGAYTSKLGLEVALATCKKGRQRSRRGPWELLADAPGDPVAACRFVEWAVTMKGRRHLRWSPGLKALLRVEDPDEASIMAMKGDEDERLFALIERRLWRCICQLELRGDVLAALGLPEQHEARAAAVELLESSGLDGSGLLFEYERCYSE